jgi:hypothetical protein
MNEHGRRLFIGGNAGLIGTIAMSLVIAAAKALQLIYEPPPRQITLNFHRKTGVLDRVSSPEGLTASWVGAHIGYGATGGALYAAIRPLIPLSAPVAGLVYGCLVWAASYLGLMPAFGLYPWPKDDSSSRRFAMIAAHAVYGVATATAVELLESSNDASADWRQFQAAPVDEINA